MDIKAQIEKITTELTADKSLLEGFKKNPIETVKKVLADKLPDAVPDEIVEKIVDGVKAKITVDKIGDIAGALGGLFKK